MRKPRACLVLVAISAYLFLSPPLRAQGPCFRPQANPQEYEAALAALKEGKQNLLEGKFGEPNVLEEVRRITDRGEWEIKRFRVIPTPPYLSKILQHVAENHPLAPRAPNLPWRIVIIDEPGNENCAYGNIIFFTVNFLRAAENEAQIAGAIGHEITHTLAAHGWRRFTLESYLYRKNISAETTKGIMNSECDPNSFIFQLQVEADHYGIEALERAGYDPSALIEFWKRRNVSEYLIASDEAFLASKTTKSRAKFVVGAEEEFNEFKRGLFSLGN